jgi:amidophosphoribosyltransferase
LGTAVGDPKRDRFCTACFSGQYLVGELTSSLEEPSKLTA